MTTYNLDKLIEKQPTDADIADIKQFYNEATADYRFWSKNFNMHYGYCTFGRTLPFLRETMLQEMNRQIMIRLNLPSQEAQVLDLGCGMGATMKYLLQNHSTLKATGVTISDFQVKNGNILLSQLNGKIKKENFLNTSTPDNSQNGVTAIESLCHSGHSKKALNEAFRVLKPGGRFVMADAFRKTNQLCPTAKYAYDEICRDWSLSGIGNIKRVEQDLKDIGFTSVKVEDVSWRVALSVFHALLVIPVFVFSKWLKGKKVKNESWKNMKGSLYGLLMGLHLRDFGYYIITAEK